MQRSTTLSLISGVFSNTLNCNNCFVMMVIAKQLTKDNFVFTMSVYHQMIHEAHLRFPEPLGDNTLRIWDASAPPRAQQTIRAHDGEVLTCDWAKYDVVSIRQMTGKVFFVKTYYILFGF